MDISKFSDPAIKCDDFLFVNMNKKEGIGVMLFVLCFLLFMLYLAIRDGVTMGIVGASMMGLLIAGVCYGIATTENPVFAIDKYGVTFDNQFHPWESIESVSVELGDEESYDRIRFHLKNKTVVKFADDPSHDLRLNVIATYLVKYFKTHQSAAIWHIA
jgi:hypothetical protein